MRNVFLKEILHIVEFIFRTRLTNNPFDAAFNLRDMLRVRLSQRFLRLCKNLRFLGLSEERLLG